nr:MAG TPA: hypothetical protein [Caudoviricetes sp.]
MYNANRMAEATETAQKNAGSLPARTAHTALPNGLRQDDITPSKRSMVDYDDIINGGTRL